MLQTKKKKSQAKSTQKDSLSGVALPKPALPRFVGSATNLRVRDSVVPQKLTIDIPIVPQQTVWNTTAPFVNTVIPISTNLISNFLNWSKVFKEFCVVGFRGELRPCTLAGMIGGFTLGCLDEKDGTPPTWVSVGDLPKFEILNILTESPSRHLIEWVPQDLEDLIWQFTDATSPTVPAWLKFYADNVNTFANSPMSSFATFALTGAVRVAFRGLQ
jgi:hypothetical protein